MDCFNQDVWTPGLIGDVYHWCDQFEYTQPNGIAYSSGFGCHSNHGYVTPEDMIDLDPDNWENRMFGPNESGRAFAYSAYSAFKYGLQKIG